MAQQARWHTAIRAVDRGKHSPFQMFPRQAADGDFDHVKFRTQPMRKERGLGTQEDLNEEVREYYSQLVPKIQQQF